MKATLKSLQAKYRSYGYEILKRKDFQAVQIFFDGYLIETILDRSYIATASNHMRNCPWLNGQSCRL